MIKIKSKYIQELRESYIKNSIHKGRLYGYLKTNHDFENCKILYPFPIFRVILNMLEKYFPDDAKYIVNKFKENIVLYSYFFVLISKYRAKYYCISTIHLFFTKSDKFEVYCVFAHKKINL